MRQFRGSLCTPHGKKMADRKSKTLFVRNLPFSTSNEKLTETFEHVGPIKTAFVVADKESGKCKGFGYVQFSMLEDAAKALESVTHCDGRKISLAYANAKKSLKERRNKITAHEDEDGSNEQDITAKPANKPKLDKSSEAKSRPPKQASEKRCRLIVRNLAFKCQEKDLRAQFKKFGDISEVVIPLKNGKLSRGFAFIQFTKLQAAQKAVAEMNAKNIMGRPVAVDWAVAKDRFEASNQQDSDKDSGVSEEEGESEDDDAGKAEKEENDSDDEEKGTESDEEEEEDESDEVEEESDSGSEDDSENDEESENESGDDSDSASTPVADKKPALQRKSDVEEGRTLFVRNIPFEAEEEELEEVFGDFGEISYVRLMTDKTTGHPKGTAFVQFKTKEAADECLAKTQEGNRDEAIVIQGRTLVVALAVSRTEAQSVQTAKKSKDQKDNRNLFLAREGMIRAGTQAAIGLSQEDLNKRMKVEQAKREKLKNQNIFVSSTRLCVHNLPTKVNENELRKVLRQTVDDSAMRITECRVMRDLNRSNQRGVSKSLGYAFVNFSTHEHALNALKGLNNSTVFGENKRPIVEFSLENRKALEAKEQRMEKSKALAKQKKEEEANQAALKTQGPAGTKRNSQQKNNQQAKKKLDKTQDVIARSMHSGPKGLPKRMGPKIRHRKRGKGDNQGLAQKGKKKKNKFQQNRPQQQPQPKAMKRKRKAGEMTDNADKLISKHKAKKARMFQS